MRTFYHAFYLSTLAILLPLTGCQDDSVATTQAEPVRGLKALRIEAQEDALVRRYPSILQPSDSTQLSFEINGRLNKIDLNVGQQVEAGEVLASLDQRALHNEVDATRAAVAEAQAANDNAQQNWQRQEQLFAKQLISVTVRDDARTSALSAQARFEQARNQLAGAETALSKSVLKAPYRGVINSVDVESFANVAPGTVVATLSNPDSFEVRFSTSSEVVSQLSVGKEVRVTLADETPISLNGRVSELSSSSATVESFPVVVQLTDINPALKAGMAVEVEMELPLADGKGYSLPLSAFPISGPQQGGDQAQQQYDRNGWVFVFDEATQTVKKRLVTVASIRDNNVIVSQGLQQGEYVAIAGVSFLRDGQTVKLLNAGE